MGFGLNGSPNWIGLAVGVQINWTSGLGHGPGAVKWACVQKSPIKLGFDFGQRVQTHFFIFFLFFLSSFLLLFCFSSFLLLFFLVFCSLVLQNREHSRGEERPGLGSSVLQQRRRQSLENPAVMMSFVICGEEDRRLMTNGGAAISEKSVGRARALGCTESTGSTTGHDSSGRRLDR